MKNDVGQPTWTTNTTNKQTWRTSKKLNNPSIDNSFFVGMLSFYEK
jgi:hypothetical protein